MWVGFSRHQETSSVSIGLSVQSEPHRKAWALELYPLTVMELFCLLFFCGESLSPPFSLSCSLFPLPALLFRTSLLSTDCMLGPFV